VRIGHTTGCENRLFSLKSEWRFGHWWYYVTDGRHFHARLPPPSRRPNNSGTVRIT